MKGVYQMNFDKWFYNQSKLVQVILLLIPFVGWIAELLIRLSVLLRDKSVINIVIFVVFVVVGWGWVLAVADLIYLLIKGHLFLA